MPALVVVLLGTGYGPVAGCGTLTGREDAAATTALRFLTAVEDGAGGPACTMLAPDSVAELAESSGRPCADAVLDADLPPPGTVKTSDVYGQWARVVLDDDTLFLAVFPGGWRVVAAGCESRVERPYDCALQGG